MSAPVATSVRALLGSLSHLRRLSRRPMQLLQRQPRSVRAYAAGDATGRTPCSYRLGWLLAWSRFAARATLETGAVAVPRTRLSRSARPRVRRGARTGAFQAALETRAEGEVSDTGARLVGITLVVATVIGLAGGYWLDRWFGTAPWLLMIGLGFGIAAGFVNLFDQSSDTTVGRQRSGQLDLDDGVKVNYGKFGDLLAEVKAVTGGRDD